MAAATYFLQACPTCGRGLEVRVEYMGRLVYCPHCNASLRAQGAAAAGSPRVQAPNLMEVADELLRRSSGSGLP
jgi:uncharacterized Zn finger protein (UPF0148 family)